MSGAQQSVELAVCTDCVLTLANGIDEVQPERAQAITDGLTAWAADGYRLAAGSDELGFSWARCEVCRDGLGGDRHQAWALPARREQTTVKALVYDDAAWWLGEGNTLMVAPIDPSTGTADWDQAHRADPMTHRDPNMVLSIAEALIADAHGPAPVTCDQVVNTTARQPGYLVRDPGGRDLARYDRLDLAQQAAAAAGGGIYAWGQVGAGPVGWHPIALTGPTTRQATPAQVTSAAPAAAGIPPTRRAVRR